MIYFSEEKMNRGLFITLEGGEGVGKSTNLSFIRDFLKNRGLNVLVTREPGGTVLAEKIRDLLLEPQNERVAAQTELLLMFAARAQHLENVIKPALNNGVWVVCDRFTDATYAYQGGGRNVEISDINWLENMIQGNFRPDLTLLLDSPVNVGLERINGRGKADRFESEQFNFFEKVRNAYLSLAKQHPQRIKVVNANQPLTAVRNDIVGELNCLIDKLHEYR